MRFDALSVMVLLSAVVISGLTLVSSAIPWRMKGAILVVMLLYVLYFLRAAGAGVTA